MLDNEHYVKLRPVPVPPLGPGRSAIRTRPCLDSLQSPEPSDLQRLSRRRTRR